VIGVQTRDSGRMIEKPVTKTDSGTQTDTHFHESNIVASYQWNEWELRRKALKLVRIPSTALRPLAGERGIAICVCVCLSVCSVLVAKKEQGGQ